MLCFIQFLFSLILFSLFINLELDSEMYLFSLRQAYAEPD